MARTPGIVNLPSIAALDRTRGQLARQLAHALREAVRRGDLRPGERLPSTRLLAQSLRLSRGTVIEAFEQLQSEGLLQAQPRSATRVCPALRPPAQGEAPARRAARPAVTPVPPQALAFAEVARTFAPLPQAPFAISVPAGQTGPDDAWHRLGRRIRARGPGAPSGYGDPQGVRALREAIAGYVRRSRSVRCDADQVIVTSGIQQALHVCCQLLLDAGDAAWVEDPAYHGITALLEYAWRQARMVRVPVDAEGIDVAAGIAMAAQARAAFVTPSHQYPLGMPMSMARRNALLAWAERHDAWIVEDDYDSEMRYAGHPFPSLQGLAPGRVIYLGTFSKILFPSLRLGYAIVPPGLAAAFCGARALMDRHPPTADQHVLAAYLEEGHLERRLRRIRGVYARRHAELAGLLQTHVPPALGWLQPSDQGMHMALWLAGGIDDRQLAAQAVAAGVAVRALSPLFSSARRRPGLLLGLGDFGHAQTQAAVQRLAGLIAAHGHNI